MGRRESPVDPAAGPVHRFASELRRLRQEAGGLTYREMARRAGYSVTTLSQAAAGERLASLPVVLPVVLAFVQAGGGNAGSWGEIRVLTPGEHPMRHAERLLAGEGGALSVVDQFEEVFTLCHDQRDRARFTDLLLQARQPQSGTGVVIAVRADFYGRCAEHRELTTALREAGGLTVERTLTAAIVADVADEAGALPLMSHALREVWRRRMGKLLTLAAYERLATGAGIGIGMEEMSSLLEHLAVLDALEEGASSALGHYLDRYADLLAGPPQAARPVRVIGDPVRAAQLTELIAASDRVADLDRPLHDPAAPTVLRPAYDSGDHIHLNDVGAEAIADTLARLIIASHLNAAIGWCRQLAYRDRMAAAPGSVRSPGQTPCTRVVPALRRVALGRRRGRLGPAAADIDRVEFADAAGQRDQASAAAVVGARLLRVATACPCDGLLISTRTPCRTPNRVTPPSPCSRIHCSGISRRQGEGRSPGYGFSHAACGPCDATAWRVTALELKSRKTKVSWGSCSISTHTGA
ncbi:helix-turn-helix domain-containing protein [Nonomuraea candida]|uniref:helix-turn-helix domain-containing protein n=1 Tax=Nonomuraea candida TaxID=359159 RepID=UPI001B80570B|nr:helix-turn-helix transcriptional regulator [Nonomuraea candida]